MRSIARVLAHGTGRCFRVALLATLALARAPHAQAPRVRARALGVKPGIFQPGPLDGITDVGGVLVGQVTIVQGDSVHTGITAILPHAGNMFTDRVPAAIFRRTAANTTYIWAISLNDRAPKLATLPSTAGSVTVSIDEKLKVTIDPAKPSVTIQRTQRDR